MISKNRNCIVVKHQSFPCSHICTYHECNLEFRWACGECIKNQLHQHGQNSQSHLMGQEDFKNYIKLIDFKQLQEQETKMSEYLRALDKITEQANQLKQYIELCLKQSDYKIYNDVQYLVDYNFFKIDNNQIRQIVKLSYNNKLTFDQNKVHQIMKIIIELSQKLLKQEIVQGEQVATSQNFLHNIEPEQNKRKIKFIQQQPISESKQVQQNQQQVQQVKQGEQQVQQQVQQYVQQPLFTQVDTQQQSTYQLHKKFEQNQYIYAAQISQDEKYLAYGGEEKVLKIYDLLLQGTKEIKFDQVIQACCFSRDSTLLYIGCEKGYFHCVQFQDNIAHIFKEQLHKDDILNIYQLEYDQIISGSQKTIIIADIKEQRKKHQLDAPENFDFSGIAINENLKIIAIGLSDCSIKFYDQQLKLQYHLREATSNPIHTIRFLADNQIIILDNSGSLKLWQIDYNNTHQQLRENKYKRQICNLGVSQLYNQIIIVCQLHFVVLDYGFLNPITIEHGQGIDVNMNTVLQLQSMNYIIIQGSNKITIMKRIKCGKLK